MRGSMRSVMVIDSETSELAATVASMRRRSRRFSAQNAASASSLSKSGTSSQFVTAFISLAAQGLVHLSLIKKLLFRFKGTGKDDSNLLPVRPVNAENARPAGGHTQIEVTRLNGEARGVW